MTVLIQPNTSWNSGMILPWVGHFSISIEERAQTLGLVVWRWEGQCLVPFLGPS